MIKTNNNSSVNSCHSSLHNCPQCLKIICKSIRYHAFIKPLHVLDPASNKSEHQINSADEVCDIFSKGWKDRINSWKRHTSAEDAASRMSDYAKFVIFALTQCQAFKKLSNFREWLCHSRPDTYEQGHTHHLSTYLLAHHVSFSCFFSSAHGCGQLSPASFCHYVM